MVGWDGAAGAEPPQAVSIATAPSAPIVEISRPLSRGRREATRELSALLL
jgi:hypothetical protein